MSETFNLVFGEAPPSLRVLIPWSGEPQLLELLPSLKKYCLLSAKSVEVIIYSRYGNLEVHRLIYDEISSSKVPCVKLDGDMDIFDFPSFFLAAEAQPARKIKIFRVHCHIVNKNIFGVHFFGANVFGLTSSNELFPDQYSSECEVIIDNNADIFISHCPHPTNEQVGNFIGHRLRKIVRSYFKRLDYVPLVLRASYWHLGAAILEIRNILSMVVADNYKDAIYNTSRKGEVNLKRFLLDKGFFEE